MSGPSMTRRSWLKQSTSQAAAAYAGALAAASVVADDAAPKAIDIGSRRELLLDDYLIERCSEAKLVAHQPEPCDVALTCDAPCEGNTSAYYSLFADGDRFRVYYRGSHFDEQARRGSHPETTCYAESTDGITWTKPKLGLFDFGGSKANNIVWLGGGTHNFSPFKDGNPAAPASAAYKALAGSSAVVDGKKKDALFAYQSADGLRWSRMSDTPVITAGAFDSQNLAFWDAQRKQYRAYWRIFTDKVRAIRTATSSDFLHWENQADLTYGDAPAEHLYTNAVQPYFRAPHLLVGFPTRFQPKTQQVEPVFMSSRDCVRFRRWPEPLVPITAPKERDGNRSNYMAHGLLSLPGRPHEMSVYATEAYYKGPASRLRRFRFRVDGFVSLSAERGEMLTRPLRFAGRALELNCQAAAGGSVRVEVQDAGGRPIDGFALDACQPLSGDQPSAPVRWLGGDVARLAGQPIRLRFVLQQADLYSLQFRTTA